jgi:hypothetical protein
MHLNLPTTWSSKFWYPSLVGSFMVSQQVFWYPNAMRTIIRWTNHLYSASMDERLSFRTILTKMTFVTISVASLMLDSTCFILGLPLGTFILAHVLVKCHFKAFVALSKSSVIFCWNQILWFAKLDSPVLIDLHWCFVFWTVIYIVAFFFASKAPSLR